MSKSSLDIKNQEEMLKKERTANNAWNKLKRNKTAMIGLVIVVIMTLMAIFSPILAPYDPNEMSLGNIHLKPGEKGHIFGTDEFGRDLLSRIIYGSRISIIVAVGGTIVGGLIGIFLGLISGFKGGIVDSIIMRFMDGMFAFPFVLLSIVLMTVLGNGLRNVILAIGIANVPRYARIVRGQVHIVKNEEYCNAVRALGASSNRLLFMHILPNIMSPIIVYATLNIAGAIISEAALSFLGLGITPPTASWGNILRAGKDSLITAPHIATISGIFILLTVLGFNLLGDGIRDVLDPKMKR
ncbi:peptide/nickel transport system permease protein [Dethiosulfatibacter aminovorans DSM 17477]|uniref:Peptide/nickel transport system permease protein n=1 Tax=Dethiosulfatibacter aminovorans DSM 17477 TaxID=1121476 RepID=A0A1M6BLD7_9FIRM|nr:ABC transporter permease [Dethiosulfatibacter aminovorans]SHI49486.1 peptide/nickel transport system permease protein [Dethiosulfatibacter aminovorans DSM 17477]